MTESPCAPAALATRRLFEPIGGLLGRFVLPRLPGVDELNRLLDETAPGAVSGSGRPIRFVEPASIGSTYEETIFATGEVPTRPEEWHDFFNALAWCVWPRAKAACNALHLEALDIRRTAGLAGRGPCRDALTQFDECGIIVSSTDEAVPVLLAAHEWEAVFWQRRRSLAETTRFHVFGHGTWDQMRRPFFGLCAKAIHRQVDAAWLGMAAAAQQAEIDQWLADHLTERAPTLTPRAFHPLPLLGIPGVTPDSDDPAYYRDTRQFRPLR